MCILHMTKMAKRSGKKASPPEMPQTWLSWLARNAAKFFAITAGSVYLLAPAIIHFNPWLLNEMVFLHRFTYPPFINLSNPAALGLNYTRALQIPSTDDVILGAWHVLPMSDHETGRVYVDEEYAKKLAETSNEIVLYLHGNLGTRAGHHRRALYKVMSQMGYHVLVPDYRGYGDSTGYPCEDSVVEDSMAVYKWIKQHNPKAKVIVWGHSLGTAIATKLVMQLSITNNPPLCLVLETPFNNLQEAAFVHPLAMPMKILPWFHWAFIESLDQQHLHFDTDQNLQKVKVPTMILHPEDDGIVPYKLGKKLYNTVKEANPDQDVEFVTFDGKKKYGHKHVWKDPELPQIIHTFVDRSKKKL